MMGKHNYYFFSRYPADKYPVYAMRGAPASFPVQPRDRDLQRYIEFSEGVSRVGDKYIADNFPDKPFIGIHLRNGMDWVKTGLVLISYFFIAQLCIYRMGSYASPSACNLTKIHIWQSNGTGIN